ncbi:MAG: helix-turn-helix domain-containing protein [Novosphingobium sp.]
MNAPRPAQRRNKGFDETHRELIATALKLIAERGAEALSITALARAMGINRTTVYYHFESREALLRGVANWAATQLSTGMDVNLSRPERIGLVSRFVLANPELIRLWIDDFVSAPDIRESYSRWDALVAATCRGLAEQQRSGEIDAEVHCVMLLAASIIGPRVYRNSVNPAATDEEVVARFVAEHERMLARDGLVREG